MYNHDFQQAACQQKKTLRSDWAIHLAIGDRHTLRLDGGLPGDAGPPLLQGQLPVGRREPVRRGAMGSAPVAVRRNHVAGGGAHGRHHVGQLAFRGVRLCAARTGGVCGTHGYPGGQRAQRGFNCARRRRRRQLPSGHKPWLFFFSSVRLEIIIIETEMVVLK